MNVSLFHGHLELGDDMHANRTVVSETATRYDMAFNVQAVQSVMELQKPLAVVAKESRITDRALNQSERNA